MAASSHSELKQQLWPITTAALALLCIVLLVVLMSGNGDRALRAVRDGQRVGIQIADGKVLGHPAKSPQAEKEEEAEAAEEETEQPAELPEIVPDTSVPEAAAPQINPAMAGNFVGERLESQEAALAASVLDKKESSPAAHTEYPVAVKQEPQTRQQSIAAPAKGVNVRDLLKVAPTGTELPKAPLKALSEKTDEGVLPKISKEGLRPWQAYGKKFSAASTDPLVSIVVVGLGMSKDLTQAALHLSEDYTLSFSPYASQPDLWANHARTDGHEVMIDLPMQMADYPASDPGPMGLLTGLKPEENKTRLHQVLARFSGYVGVALPVGGSVPAAVIQSCLTDIAARGLLVLEAPQSGEAPALEQKQQMGMISLKPDLVVDSNLDADAIMANLQVLTEKAKKNGQAIGIVRAYPLTLERLQAWQETLAQEGVRLAPVSALAVRVSK